MNKSTDKVDVYSIVTNRIINALETGTVPWRKTWASATGGAPVNHSTGKAYRGINWFMLQLTGFESSRWVTFKQAIDLGGNVRKGEKANLVTFWKKWKTKDKSTGDEIELPVLRYYHVFNLEQCEGIEAPSAAIKLNENQRIQAAEAIVTAMPTRPQIRHSGGRCVYSPAFDTVTMPEIGRFTCSEEYYASLFHELAHATGHTSRLNRIKESASFGSEPYGKEELVAEMTAAFLCAACQIEAPVIENQAAYIDGWLRVIKGDKKFVIVAAAAAAKAADYILGKSWDDETPIETPATVENPAPVVVEAPAVGQLSLF